MSSDLVAASDYAAQIERSADPAEFVVQTLERAKAWLASAIEHGEIEQIVELKSQAEAIRIYAMSKQLGKDAEISAAEIVRRAERGIGVAIRRGQRAGTVKTTADGGRRARNVDVPKVDKKSPSEYFDNRKEWVDAYAVTDDVSDEQFETALVEAKAARNMSRANVVRQVRAITNPAAVPPARRRRPLPEAFRDAAYDLAKAAEKAARLTDDDRFPQNAAQVARTCRYDLHRAAELLATVISRFPPLTKESTE